MAVGARGGSRVRHRVPGCVRAWVDQGCVLWAFHGFDAAHATAGALWSAAGGAGGCRRACAADSEARHMRWSSSGSGADDWDDLVGACPKPSARGVDLTCLIGLERSWVVLS